MTVLFLTKHFGEIEVDESKIITFEEGIPGFTHCTKYILLEDTQDDGKNSGLISWLQSLDEPVVAFVLMNVFIIMPDYDPVIHESDIESLGEYNEEDFLIYNIAVVPDDISKVSVNLKAPVVIHAVTRKGRQVVAANDDYGIRVQIFEEIKKSKGVV